jgi:hypothetical protein
MLLLLFMVLIVVAVVFILIVVLREGSEEKAGWCPTGSQKGDPRLTEEPSKLFSFENHFLPII